MGIYGGLLGILIANWTSFSGKQNLEQIRCILLFFVIFAIMINLLFIGGDNLIPDQVDRYGHLGGCMTGLFWGMAIFPRKQCEHGAKVRKFGTILFAGFMILFTLLLFVLR